jgi:hypothetical protein
MTIQFRIHNDAGDLVAWTPKASKVPALVQRAIVQNLRQHDGPSDGRFGRVNIAAFADGRYLGQQTLQGIHLHPLVRATMARGTADALEQSATYPGGWADIDTASDADPVPGAAEVVALDDLLPAE